ncbi:MAG: YbdK family carboxylate-amine ligase [Desulfobulbaceae bacterium]|nr:YbdK family carboxylate-amine ligase [Desulfobulbaceae bacterium]
MQPLEFIPSDPFTIGVELEFQLLDPVTYDLTPSGPKLLKKIDSDLRPYVKAEFIQSMVEICTPVCNNMTEVADKLGALCKSIYSLSSQSNCIPFATSLHPFALINARQTSPGKRYHEIMDHLQIAGRRMMTQAMHVHIGMDDKERTIQVCNDIRQYLPILLALTTSSPFLEGENTGFYSYRTNIFCCLPRTGIPDTLRNWKDFEEIIVILNEATILNGIKELWWDVRPHPDFGTIEIRICDLPSQFNQVLAIAALIQALVATLADSPEQRRYSKEIITHNKWHAARYGLDGTFINHRPGRHPTFKSAAEDLLSLITPKAKSLNSGDFLRPINDILAQGSSAHRQLKLHKEHDNLQSVIEILQKEFWQ